ncbi:hypothetical protein Tco_0706307 [Tanacetum coccineum]|uniref:CCHC-type domain-containing protein n=1 Tax=Tanacetum coccineum TaxID=301880 RepID=A0ABQ4Y728_9ASTR
MSTQQDIYAAGSENRPPMLNKENYVPWSSRLLRYAKSRPNGKLIYNSIMNGPYVRRMIPEPGDTDREVPVPATFHEQTDDELTVAEIKQMEADDQAIQTILLGLPEDIYAAVDSCETAQEIWLRVQQMMKGSDIGIQEKKAKLFNEWERFTSTDGESIESYYHRFSKLMNDFKRLQNVGNQVVQNAVQNQGVQNVGNQNGIIVVPGITNQNPNGNGNVVAARAEGNVTGNNGNQRCYNCRGLGRLARNCTVRPRRRQLLIFRLIQASTSGTQTDKAPVYDSDGSAEVHNYDNCYDNEIFNMFTQEEQYTELLEPIPEPHQVQQNDSKCLFQKSRGGTRGGTVDQHPATSVYQEQCLTKKINALHLSSGKQITTLNEEISNLSKQLSTEKSTVSSLLEEKKKLKSDFKIREDELLDKQIQLENKIKELDNILVKTAQRKQQSLYNGKVLLEKHDPPVVHDSEETLQLAQESRQKMKQLNKEIKPANYTKINHLSGVFVSQTAKSQEEVYFLNTSKTATVSKSISIPNEEFLDDTTPSVARKFLNEVKSTIVTLQRVVKHRMTLDTHNWSSIAHQEIHKILKEEIFPIINQVDTRLQNFEIQFLKEAAKFVRDFKSLAKEADESLLFTRHCGIGN